MKKNIVIIPAGPGALFQEWTDYSGYNFDLAIVKWVEHDLKNIDQAAYVETIPGRKWPIIKEFSSRHNLSSYEHIWVLDDDCLTSPNDIHLIFDMCKEYNLDLAQPALTEDSFKTHQSTFLIPGAKLHITDTVEIMCPIFSQRAWPECSAHFEKMPAGVGYGLEGYWASVLDSYSGTTKFGGRVADIDQYPVKHTRPVSGPADYSRMGINPDNDSRYFDNLGYRWTFKTIEIIR